MSSNIWTIGQQQDAKTTFDTNVKRNSAYYESKALNKITDMCKEMNETFSDIIEDQNNYILEFDDIQTDFIEEQNNINQTIEKLLAEIKTLEAKEQNGTITEEEQKELAAKKGELESLYNTQSAQYAEKKTELENKQQQLANIFGQKEKVAADYGSYAVDKGSDFLDEELTKKEANGEKVKYNIFNSKHTRHFVGKNAVKEGSELLDKVKHSDLINEKILSKNMK